MNGFMSGEERMRRLVDGENRTRRVVDGENKRSNVAGGEDVTDTSLCCESRVTVPKLKASLRTTRMNGVRDRRENRLNGVAGGENRTGNLIDDENSMNDVVDGENRLNVPSHGEDRMTGLVDGESSVQFSPLTDWVVRGT